MDLSTAFSQIHWLAVILATLAAFVIGGLWYSKLLFGNAWSAELKAGESGMPTGNTAMIFGTSFFLNLVACIVLAMFLGKSATLVSGLTAGLLVGVAWVGTAFGTSYLFSRKSLTLFFIDAGYYVVYYAVMGIILGAM